MKQESKTTDCIEMVLRRHPHGITERELVGSIVGPDCTTSQALQKFRDALSDGRVRLGWGGRLYAPKEETKCQTKQ